MAGAPMGGAEGFYERLSIALHKAGDEVLPVIRRDEDRALRLVVGGLVPVQLGFRGPLDLLTAPRLRRALEDFAPDVAIAWMNRAARFAGRALPKPRRVPLIGRLGGYYDLKYYRGFDHLVGNTWGIQAWLIEQGWPADRAHMLPNFVEDFSGHAPATLAGNTRLLAMGRLHRNKGFDTLLRALPDMPAGAHLSLAGEGPEHQALQRLAGELGVADRVTFLGWRQDRGALLAGCDIFLCPSRHEPLGNVVLEAFSAGRPVIAAASHGPREVIRDGETGLLVPIEDAPALAAATAALIADPQRAAELAQQGRTEFETTHAEVPVVAQWRGFLHRIAKERA
ncbi:glycosyltransferase [Plastoroseomonas hellenica]|uniref:glycosyltransferase n=1 Tax=Plastoroseomonas hellenica TaxID=2687306 RepID=UPI001BA65917|nr:glycosyltransferase [Plastoroseomonas hellenica]MBR0645355.1 glycosyltransferase [Plastoroseomonas hellenica]